jgi:hypothetical protein
VHLVLDNSSTHKTPQIQRWLTQHPRFVLHLTGNYLALSAEPTRGLEPRTPSLRDIVGVVTGAWLSQKHWFD